MYNVVLLIERGLSRLDAEQVRSLHTSIDDQVTYHLLLPVEDAVASLTGSLTALGREEVAPIGYPAGAELAGLQESFDATSRDELAASAALRQAAGGQTTTTLTRDDPISALTQLVRQCAADEVIVLTRAHAVAEFFHVDWSARARRHLNVPTLHLLEQETFDEQSSGAGEGNTGL